MLTLFTSCFLKFLICKKTTNLSNSMLLTITILNGCNQNVRQCNQQCQVIIVYAYIIVCLFIKSGFLRFYASCTSYHLTENTRASLGGKKGLADTIASIQNTCSSPICHYACLRFYNHCVYVTTYKYRQRNLYYFSYIVNQYNRQTCDTAK